MNLVCGIAGRLSGFVMVRFTDVDFFFELNIEGLPYWIKNMKLVAVTHRETLVDVLIVKYLEALRLYVPCICFTLLTVILILKS